MIYLEDGNLEVGNVSFWRNLISRNSSYFQSNQADFGGAIFASKNTFLDIASDTQFVDNHANYSEGAIFAAQWHDNNSAVMKKECFKVTHHRWGVRVGEIYFVALTLKYSGSETDRVQWNFITLVEGNKSQGVYGLGLVAMSKSSDNRSLNDALDVTIGLSATLGGAYFQPSNGEVNVSFVVLPCPPGYQKLQEGLCYPCDASSYSMTGGAQGCSPCPVAEVCIKQIPTIGNLTMIIQKGLKPIIDKSTLERCPYAEACNESNCTLTYELNNTQNSNNSGDVNKWELNCSNNCAGEYNNQSHLCSQCK